MQPHAIKQFVFGYGSLICPHSRAITAPSVAAKDSIPVMVKNVERTWAKRSRNGMTAMGVRFKDEAECVGVLMPVNDEELSKFDEREVGYNRVPLYLGDINKVDFLDDELHYDNLNNTGLEPHHMDALLSEGSSYEEEKTEELDAQFKIWMYVPKVIEPPSPEAPIAQSYVDTILRGCLTISEDFAHEFVSKTVGWAPQEIYQDEVDEIYKNETKWDDDDASIRSDDYQLQNQTQSDIHWVNDRHNPIYWRGDEEYMRKHADKLDEVIARHRQEQLEQRTHREPEPARKMRRPITTGRAFPTAGTKMGGL